MATNRSTTVSITTELDAPAPIVWSAVTTPHAFVHVTRGALRFRPAERVDRRLQVGDEFVGWTLLFGIIPMTRHRIAVESIDDSVMEMVSDESGGPVRSWRHLLRVEPVDDRRCRYEDRIEIDAGVLTPIVVGMARLFYRYRQHRWRGLARLLAAVTSP